MQLPHRELRGVDAAVGVMSKRSILLAGRRVQRRYEPSIGAKPSG